MTSNPFVRRTFATFRSEAPARVVIAFLDATGEYPLVDFRPPPDDLRDYLESQFDNVDRRFKTMQAQLDCRFDTVEGRIDTVEEEVGKLESRLDEINHK